MMPVLCDDCGCPIKGQYGYVGGAAVCAACLPDQLEVARRIQADIAAARAEAERDLPLYARQQKEAQA